MSYYIDFDSYQRDREVYANENAYTLTPEQVRNWFAGGIGVAHGPIAMSAKVINVTLPYTASLLNHGRIYVDIHTQSMDDATKIRTIGGVNRRAKFVMLFDKIQNDSNGDPLYIHYKSCMDHQILRFSMGFPVSIEIFDRNGTTLTQQDASYPTVATATAQSLILLELTPRTGTSS